MDSKTNLKEPTYPGYGIDFIKSWPSPNDRGAPSCTNFDVLPEVYNNGVETGTRMAFKLMAALEKMPDDGTPDGLARSAIEEASRLCDSEDGKLAFSLRGAANGVLIAFEELIVDLARSGAWRSTMAKSLKSELDYLRHEFDTHASATFKFAADLGVESITADVMPVEAPTSLNEVPSDLSPSARTAIQNMASQADSLADLCNGEGMIVDVLDHASSLYREAAEATENDVLLSILCSAESFAASAWALARCQAIDDGQEQAPHVALLKTFKDQADEFANKFDCGGAYHPATTPGAGDTKESRAPVERDDERDPVILVCQALYVLRSIDEGHPARIAVSAVLEDVLKRMSDRLDKLESATGPTDWNSTVEPLEACSLDLYNAILLFLAVHGDEDDPAMSAVGTLLQQAKVEIDVMTNCIFQSIVDGVSG